MNSVEAADLLRQRLDAYGCNFRIQCDGIPGGLHLASTPGHDKIWDLRVSDIMMTVRFERPDGEISINHCATALDVLVDDIVRTVQEHLKPIEKK
jgi:hypothetical protein